MGQPYGGTEPAGHPPRAGDRSVPSGPTPEASSASEVYSRPMTGQVYPPLGYAPDGTALFRPGQPTNTEVKLRERAAAEEARESAPAATEPPRRRSPVSGATALLVVGILGLVVITVMGLDAIRDRQTADTFAERPLLTDTAPRTFEPPTVAPDEPGPGIPGGPGRRIDPLNKPVSYEVTLDGQATILYVDDTGLKSEFAPTSPWTVDFTGSYNPLRLLVIAGTGSGASCSISVDGEVVAEDSITASSSRRTASCVP